MSTQEEREEMESIAANSHEKSNNRLFWRIMRWLGGPGVLLAAAGLIFWAQMKAHTEDGHPETLKVMVHTVQETLIKIETGQAFMRRDLDQIKKNQISRNNQ